MSLGILPKGISVSWQTQHSTFHLRFALVPSCLLSFISVVSADHQKKKKNHNWLHSKHLLYILQRFGSEPF